MGQCSSSNSNDTYVKHQPITNLEKRPKPKIGVQKETSEAKENVNSVKIIKDSQQIGFISGDGILINLEFKNLHPAKKMCVTYSRNASFTNNRENCNLISIFADGKRIQKIVDYLNYLNGDEKVAELDNASIIMVNTYIPINGKFDFRNVCRNDEEFVFITKIPRAELCALLALSIEEFQIRRLQYLLAVRILSELILFEPDEQYAFTLMPEIVIYQCFAYLTEADQRIIHHKFNTSSSNFVRDFWQRKIASKVDPSLLRPLRLMGQVNSESISNSSDNSNLSPPPYSDSVSATFAAIPTKEQALVLANAKQY